MSRDLLRPLRLKRAVMKVLICKIKLVARTWSLLGSRLWRTYYAAWLLALPIEGCTLRNIDEEWLVLAVRSYWAFLPALNLLSLIGLKGLSDSLEGYLRRLTKELNLGTELVNLSSTDVSLSSYLQRSSLDMSCSQLLRGVRLALGVLAQWGGLIVCIEGVQSWDRLLKVRRLLEHLLLTRNVGHSPIGSGLA